MGKHCLWFFLFAVWQVNSKIQIAFAKLFLKKTMVVVLQSSEQQK